MLIAGFRQFFMVAMIAGLGDGEVSGELANSMGVQLVVESCPRRDEKCGANGVQPAAAAQHLFGSKSIYEYDMLSEADHNCAEAFR